MYDNSSLESVDGLVMNVLRERFPDMDLPELRVSKLYDPESTTDLSDTYVSIRTTNLPNGGSITWYVLGPAPSESDDPDHTAERVDSNYPVQVYFRGSEGNDLLKSKEGIRVHEHERHHWNQPVELPDNLYNAMRALRDVYSPPG